MRDRVRAHRRLAAAAICLALAACQPPPPAPLAQAPDPSPVDGIGYVFLEGPISRGSSALLIGDLDKLQAQGAREIALGINSAGGEVDAAQAVVAEMDRLHAQAGITFDAYDLRLVASAATLPFLDAQARYAAPHSGFLFHAPFMAGAGTFSAQTLRQEADRIDRAAAMFRQALLARTHLTAQQADVYTTRTVLLSTEDALNDGVIDAVRAMTPPKQARAWVVRSQRKTPAPASSPS